MLSVTFQVAYTIYVSISSNLFCTPLDLTDQVPAFQTIAELYHHIQSSAIIVGEVEKREATKEVPLGPVGTRSFHTR